MNITIVGAGNIGLQFAVHCREKGHAVKIYTNKNVSPDLTIVNEDGNIIHKCSGLQISNDEKSCFFNADLIFITYPAFMTEQIEKTIYPFINTGKMICLVPGTGGGELVFKKCIQKGAIVFGLQRVPSVSRIIEPYKTVRCVGYRTTLHVAAIQSKYSQQCATIIHDIFDMPVEILPNYLNITLTPSNPLLHTSRLFNLFGEKQKYIKIPLFYEDWNDETSKLLLEMDEELQKICKAIPLNLNYVKSLKEHYESPDYVSLTNKIKSIKGFKGILTPMLEEDGHYVPDFNSRYFTADFNYGLSIIIQISKLTGLSHPYMDMVYNWYKNLNTQNGCFDINKYGIETIDDLVDFYNK